MRPFKSLRSPSIVLAIESRLTALGLSLPDGAPSHANFLLFLAGQICEWNGVPRYFGPVDQGYDLTTAKKAAELCAINLLFNIRLATGSLEGVAAVLRLGAFVAAPAGFGDGPKIADGASELFSYTESCPEKLFRQLPLRKRWRSLPLACHLRRSSTAN